MRTKFMSASTVFTVRAVLLLLVVSVFSGCDFLQDLLGNPEDDFSPTLVSGLITSGYASFSTAARDVVAEGDYAYVATYTYSGTYGGVAVVDITNPASPVRVGSYFPSASSTSLYPSCIAKSGDHVYVNGGNVRMFAKVNVSSPSSPYRVYQVDGGDYAMDMAADGSTLYYASYDNEALYMYDVSDTYAAVKDFTYYAPDGAAINGCFAESGFVFVLTSSGYLRILQANDNRTSVTEIASLNIGAGYNLTKVGNYLYTQQSTDKTIKIIDVTDPGEPELKSSLTIANTGPMTVGQSCLFIGSAQKIDMYDVGDPAEPAFVATHNDAYLSGCSGISLAGDTLALSDGGGGSGRLRLYTLVKD